MNTYTPKKLSSYGETITVRVPASKSITNRALLLAALSRGKVLLTGGELSADTRAFLECLKSLAIPVTQTADGIEVHGCGGDIPNKRAQLNVQSAGTAARFLTVALAFCGGEYVMSSSEQMKKRPMKEAIELLRAAGVTVECLEKEGHFPFLLRSNGITQREFTISTDRSSQYASALLLTAGALSSPTKIRLIGARTQGSYVGITLKMLTDFAVPYEKNGDEITVFPAKRPPERYEIEPDLSGACYFYALSLLLSRKVLVKGVHLNSMQGDKKFLNLLTARGVSLCDTPEGVLADGSKVTSFDGFDEDLQDYSDQTLTVAALAPFATTPSALKNVAHIRLQECDRIAAIVQNLTALGISARTDGKNIFIQPATVTTATVKTFDDHRVAMAFALVGLKTGTVTVENPDCCRKTFENFFEILDNLQ